VVQEQLDQIPLQQEEPLLVQPEDDVPYTLPMIPQPEVVLQDLVTDQCLDIRFIMIQLSSDDGGISAGRF
jgi:hypothetical protein